jgi:transposase
MKFIAMDAHSRHCFFVVLGERGQVLKSARVKTQENELLGFVRSVTGRKKLTFEEGVMSQWLYLVFKNEVDELVVCQPTEKHGPKTDKIDTVEMADLLRVGRLKSVYHEDSSLMKLRALISGYDDLIQEIVRTKNRYKALFCQVGAVSSGTRLYKSPDAVSLLDTDEQRYVASALLKQIELLEAQQVEYLERFEANARQYKPIKLLMSIPGIGVVRANQIVGVMVTPHRFPNKYNLFSYAMLIRHNRESDGKLYGKQRAHGNTVLKAVFKSAFFSATHSDTAFRRKYEEMRAAGKDDRAARNAVARKIAAAVLGVWKTGKKYHDHYEEVTQRQHINCHSGERESLS